MVSVDRPGVAAGRPTFVTSERLSRGTQCVLDDQASRHMRVLRLNAGAMVGLRDGQGGVGAGRIIRLTKSQAVVEIDETVRLEPPPAVHLLVPVADRDRMLWLAEKSCELGLTSWRPVWWRRSRSVSPRGEGATFQSKVRGRMEGALAQSEGAWMPQLFPEATLERALVAAPQGDRMVLHPEGTPMIGRPCAFAAPVVIALGPEGGIEDDEMMALDAAGFARVRLGSTILRFETAGMAAVAIARSSPISAEEVRDG